MVLATLLLAGCRVATDVGEPCVLVRANPDGGPPLPLTEAELATADVIDPVVRDGSQTTAGHPHVRVDFISFGSADCEEFICVRAKDHVPDAGPADVARGTCSRRCTVGSRCGDSRGGTTACRALLLSTEALGGLDGGFPGARTSEFCVPD